MGTHTKHRRGFSLIAALVAVGIFTLVGLGTIAAVTALINLISTSFDRSPNAVGLTSGTPLPPPDVAGCVGAIVPLVSVMPATALVTAYSAAICGPG